MGLSLTCKQCGKTQSFRDIDQVEKKGWVIVREKHTFDTALCPECVEKRRSGELEK